MVSPELLEILVCPDCHAAIFQDGDSIQCSNGECRRRYPTRDDIPVMLIDESEILDLEAFAQALTRRKDAKA